MNVIDLLRARGIEPGRPASSGKGGEYHSACPGCGDGGKGKDSDRFHVWPEQNNGSGSYWCRQCGCGGDGIQFLIDFEGLGYKAACEKLGRDPGEKPAVRMSPSMAAPGAGAGGSRAGGGEWSPRAFDSPGSVWREKAGNFMQYCQGELMGSPEMLAWLAGRGIDEYTVSASGLGYNPKDLFRPREAWGLAPEIKDNGQKKKLWLPAGIVIPRVDTTGQVNRLRVRRFPDGPANGAGGEGKPGAAFSAKKYYVVPGSAAAPSVYGDMDLDAWVIVEAELDGLLIYAAAGDLVAVCALGSNTNRPDTSIFSKIKGSLCILDALDYDGGGSGQQGWWQAQFDQVIRWPVPEGKDPGEAYAAGVDIREWIVSGLPPRWRVGSGRRVGRSLDAPAGAGLEAVGGGSVGGASVDGASVGGASVGGASVGGGAVDGGAGLVPEKVSELARVMKNTPVSIVTRPKRITIVCDVHGWDHKNWDVYSRISDLLFGDDEVYLYVRALPSGRYTWRNLANV